MREEILSQPRLWEWRERNRRERVRKPVGRETWAHGKLLSDVDNRSPYMS